MLSKVQMLGYQCMAIEWWNEPFNRKMLAGMLGCEGATEDELLRILYGTLEMLMMKRGLVVDR